MTAFVLTAVLAVSAPVPKEVKEAQEKFRKEVAAAREKAIDFLKRQQNPNGTWEPGVVGLLADMEGGQTALAALALLEAGVKTDDEALAKAIEYLAKLAPKKTYVVGLQTQVLAEADPKATSAETGLPVSSLVVTVKVPSSRG